MPTTYSPRYEEDFPWSAPDPKDRGSARCKWCNKSFKIDTMGKVAFNSHEKSKLHQSHIQVRRTNMKLTCFQLRSSDDPAKNSGPSVSGEAEPTSSGSGTSSNVSSCSSMKKYVLREKVITAEILWALQTVYTHNSNRSACADVDIFKKMFPDSEIASQMKMGRTKIGYMITYGLAPYFQENLFKTLNQASKIVVGFDESLNKIAQRQQMDISVRYFDEAKREVHTSYVGSAFLSSTRASDLLNGLKQCLKNNPSLLKKIVQISMDGPHVNWKVVRDLSCELREHRESSKFEILSIGSCGLHVVHNAFKSGIKNTEWNVGEFLFSLYILFKNVPLRRAEYTAVTSSALFPLKFCEVRWVENFRVADRAIKMLPFLKVFVDAVKNQRDKKIKEAAPEFKRSFTSLYNAKSFAIVAEAVKDRFLEAKLAFFMSMANAVEPFLKEFQTDVPMAPFLYDELVNLIKPIMEKVLKPEVFNGNKKLASIELSDDNLLPASRVEIGFAAKTALKTVVGVKEQQVLMFRKECKSFYVAFLQKIFERSPLFYPLTRYISCLSPYVIAESPETAKKRLSFALEHEVERDHMAGAQADMILNEYRTLIVTHDAKLKFSAYRRDQERLDVFWDTILIESGQFQNLRTFVRDILILSHGNAALERGFSVNKDCLVPNQEEESLIAQRIVYDAVAKQGGVDSVSVSKGLIQYARNAHQAYLESLDKKKKEQQDSENERQRKRDAARMLQELQSKRAKILAETQKEMDTIDKQMKELRK